MTAKEALEILWFGDQRYFFYEIDDAKKVVEQALEELEAIKSADSVEAMEELEMIREYYDEDGEDEATCDSWNILKNYILKAQAQEQELRELKANQIKIKTIEGYGIDDVLAIIQGLQSKEITPEILHNNLLMYKKGYENGIKISRFYIEKAFKNIKGSEE